MRDGMKITYNQEWEEPLAVTVADNFDKPKGAGLFDSDGPQAFMYNMGMPAHKGVTPEAMVAFQKLWSDRSTDPAATPPLVNIFLLPVALQGQRNVGWSRQAFRASSELLEVSFKASNFAVINQEQLSMPWPVETTGGGDGFHYSHQTIFVTNMIAVNMICNAPKELFTKERIHEWYAMGDKLSKQTTFDSSGTKHTNTNTRTTYFDYQYSTYKNKNGLDVSIAETNKECKRCAVDPFIIPYNVVDLYKVPMFGEGEGEGEGG
jgi:hypothetical protein